MPDRAKRIYLDHNASAPLRACARATMLDAMDLAGNPSSVHGEGRAARAVLEDARRAVAAMAHVSADRLVFTSGASEAAATLLVSDWLDGDRARRFDRLAVCAADHPALRSGGRFDPADVTRLPIDPLGRLDMAALETWLEAGGHPLVAVAAANGETGIVQDIAPIAERVHRCGGALVVDASQIAGRRSLEPIAALADAMVLSSHKIGGPKGIGAMALGRASLCPQPLVTGGPQETRRRAGTPAPMLAAGFGAAAAEASGESPCAERMAAMRDAFEAGLLATVPATILGRGGDRLPQTSAFQLSGRCAETVQIAADLAGIAISAGAACQSGKLGRSDALDALHATGAAVDPGLGFLRASFGPTTRADDLEQLLAVLVQLGGRTGDSISRAA